MRLVLGKGGVRPQEGRNLAPRVYSARDAPAVGLVPAAVSHSDSTPKTRADRQAKRSLIAQDGNSVGAGC